MTDDTSLKSRLAHLATDQRVILSVLVVAVFIAFAIRTPAFLNGQFVIFPLIRDTAVITIVGLAQLVTLSIGHLNLDGLGDEQALDRIRERLLAINDSGAGIRSAGSALHALQELLDELQRDVIAPAGEALPPLREELAAARAAVREQARLNRRRAEALARQIERHRH